MAKPNQNPVKLYSYTMSSKTFRYILWGALALLALILFAITTEYLTFQDDTNFLLEKQDIVHDPFWRTVFYIHVFSGMMVILIAPFQFFDIIRNKYIKLHRLAGKFYVYGILLFAAPTGIIMAFYAEGGFWSTIAFLIMGVLWLVSTLIAVIKIKNKNLHEHKIWMMRSFALSFAAVTLRLLVPAFSEILGYEKELIIVSTAWLSWLLNLFIAEGMIFAMERKVNKLKLNN